MSFDELRKALEAQGVEWVPRPSSNPTALVGYFQRMHQGLLRQAGLYLDHKDDPVERWKLENIYRNLVIAADTDTWN